MVVLKRLYHGLKLNTNNRYHLKASTLMETLVATVLIVVIFMIASMILNQLFSNTIHNNTRAIEAHLNSLHYQYEHKQIQLPYADNFKDWEIEMTPQNTANSKMLTIEATHIKTKKILTKTITRYP